MSIDTVHETRCSTAHTIGTPMDSKQWQSLCRKILARGKKVSAVHVFGKAAKDGGVYRWGIAASTGKACDETVQHLSRMACGASGNKKAFDLAESIEALLDPLERVLAPSSEDAANAILATAALPALSRHLDQSQWWRLVTAMMQLRESVLQRGHAYDPVHLMLGGELGLTLAWRLADIPICKQLAHSSIDALTEWSERDDESLTAAICPATDARLVLASLVRCQRIIKKTTRRKTPKQQRLMGDELATWVAAMTTQSGASAFGAAGRKALADDAAPEGLLPCAAAFDPESLKPAVSAALGATQTGGRLAWEVCLPDAFHHDPQAKLAIMFPDWDVRRGRTHIDYSDEDVRVEVFAGRSEVFAGSWQTLIETDGIEQQACGKWEEVCEYTDDDVHYLEIEQPWTGNLLLQRQMMLVRDDRCLLFADAVLTSGPAGSASPWIQYSSRLPLASAIEVEPENETRELFLSDGRRRGLALPLSASEWRIGPTDATLESTEDRHLLLSSQGRGRLYVPLWLDFQQRRFKRKRTWRQLTIGDQLRIVGRDEAVGYRVQIGSEQWTVYRSLSGQCCRTILGKHMNAGFFCSRFDPGDGNHEELVTVDDGDLADD